MAGLDESRMHRSDRDLVDTGALDLDERIRTSVVHHGGAGPASWRIGYQPSGQCWCRTSRRRNGWPMGTMPNRSWISRSNRLAGNERAASEGISGRRRSTSMTSSIAPVGGPGGEEVDDTKSVRDASTRCDEGQAESPLQQHLGGG